MKILGMLDYTSFSTIDINEKMDFTKCCHRQLQRKFYQNKTFCIDLMVKTWKLGDLVLVKLGENLV